MWQCFQFRFIQYVTFGFYIFNVNKIEMLFLLKMQLYDVTAQKPKLCNCVNCSKLRIYFI